MKRAFLAVLTLFAMALPVAAHAEWVTKEIFWKISGIGPTGTSTTIWVRDTTHQAVGGGASNNGDTTGVFSLDDAEVPPRGAALSSQGSMTIVNAGGGAGIYTQRDTTVLAYIIVQADSAGVAVTPTATNITMFVDGRAGSYGPSGDLGEGWVKADSTFINGAAGGHFETGNDSYGIPIRTISPYGNVQRWPVLRARLRPATGGIQSARVFIRYWRPGFHMGGQAGGTNR